MITARPHVGPIGTPRPDEPDDALILCWLSALLGKVDRLERQLRAVTSRRREAP